MTDVNTKPMPDNKFINGNYSDLTRELDNLTLRKKEYNDKISNDELIERTVSKGNLPAGQLYGNKTNQGKSALNAEVTQLILK